VQIAEYGDNVPQAVAYDRDVGGSTNIGMRGVCAICHIKGVIPGYPWVPGMHWPDDDGGGDGDGDGDGDGGGGGGGGGESEDDMAIAPVKDLGADVSDLDAD
jgi:hypothetical protein